MPLVGGDKTTEGEGEESLAMAREFLSRLVSCASAVCRGSLASLLLKHWTRLDPEYNNCTSHIISSISSSILMHYAVVDAGKLCYFVLAALLKQGRAELQLPLLLV